MIQEIRVSSFEDYISKVNDVKKEMWFRGVVNKNYSLTPGSVRHGLNGARETSAVLDFMASYQSYHQPISSPWELYSLMQHYGFPTRLLDWSTSMLVAMYFALDGEAGTDKSGAKIDRVVWGMTAGVLNQTNFLGQSIIPMAVSNSGPGQKYLPSPLRTIEEDETKFGYNPLALKTPFTNRRVHAQKGCFTVHGDNDEGIEEVMINNKLSHELVKFVFDEEAAQTIRRTLHKMEINEDDIYQDLNSLSKRIIRKRKIGK